MHQGKSEKKILFYTEAEAETERSKYAPTSFSSGAV